MSDDNHILDILDLTLTPALPRLGHQLRCQMDARLKEPVDLTRIICNVVMKFGPLKMLDRNYTLPDLLAIMGAGLSGDPKPPAGPWKQTWYLQIPETVPVAEHRIRLRARTGHGKGFFALDIPVDFRRRNHPFATNDTVSSRMIHSTRHAVRRW
ncbi:hypothetical protein [Streptomyces brasiliensis]|uniref:hypothetical protein n=1 Tax=Streptomyces brasiliensis TaxID=1954 RepID=UPI00166FF01F|nr:hypothetical protein [Streptomyces brasiliensis]